MCAAGAVAGRMRRRPQENDKEANWFGLLLLGPGPWIVNFPYLVVHGYAVPFTALVENLSNTRIGNQSRMFAIRFYGGQIVEPARVVPK